MKTGLRQNLPQFVLLVAVNALVGGMLGQERTVLPMLATQVFDLSNYTAVLTFVAAFGAFKAVSNLAAGALADRYGRKAVLVGGWLIAAPVPLLLIWAPNWGWVIVANVLLGISQGLTWSATVIMKIDLVAPARRGLAMGLNEAAGYVAVALTALLTGAIAESAGLRPQPFFLGIAYAAVGLGLSAVVVRETRGFVGPRSTTGPSTWQTMLHTSFRERTLATACRTGLVNNLNDGVVWGLLPILVATRGAGLGEVGLLAALYPLTWGLGQLATGWFSDHVGRKPLIAGGMLVQAAALGVLAASSSTLAWGAAAIALGGGTAMVYPTLLAVVGDRSDPGWRARAVGTYRFWRDAGFAVGAVFAGVIADAYGIRAAVWAVAALTAISAADVALRMSETYPRRGIPKAGLEFRSDVVA